MESWVRSLLRATGLTIVASLLLSAGTSTAAPPSPQTLHQRLLTRPFPKARLPSGFSQPTVSELTLTTVMRRRGMVGRVGVEIEGPLDEQNAIVFSVYGSAAQAEAAVGLPARKGWTRVGPVSGIRKPSVTQTGALSGVNALGQRYTYGVTSMAVADGNVVVQGVSSFLEDRATGNAASARKLLGAALVHLARLRAR